MSISFDAIAFAGGGNRCYWQGGFWDALNARHPQRPSMVVGVSAGAFQAAFSILGIGDRVRKVVIGACEEIEQEVVWSELLAGRSPFIVGRLYRELIEAVFGPEEMAALKSAPELLIQLTHPPRLMPALVAAYGAIGAYQIEKALTGAAHSRAGRYLGLTASWVSSHAMTTPAEMRDALMATATVPPFMPIGRFGGRAALDGGLVDNPPVDKISEVEATGGRTLVLATRASAKLPEAPGRTIVKPSIPIVASRFAVTDGAAIQRAYELGLKDGEAFARGLKA
ncbi:MAG: patatin-like phospholipase family protein [Alphaproteobacteria bacterium]